MRIVYMCDFCNFTCEDKNIITQHEKECFNNPDNKLCGSCYYYENYGFRYKCSNEDISFDEFYNIDTEDVPCQGHKKIVDSQN